MKIKYLELENFRIYKGSVKFDFNNKKLIILCGPNGNGKSTIYDSIEWCLTGKIERYTSSKEKNFNYIVNNDLYEDKNYCTSVKIVFDDNQFINRYETDSPKLHKKKYDKGVVINNKESRITVGNEEIYAILSGDKEMLGFSKYLRTLKKTIILSQDEISKFVLSDNPEKRMTVFQDIMGLDTYGEKLKKYLEKYKKEISPLLKNSEKSLDTLKNSLNQSLNNQEKNLLILENKNQIIKNNCEISEENLINEYNTFFNNNEEFSGKTSSIDNIQKEILSVEVDKLKKENEKVKLDYENVHLFIIENIHENIKELIDMENRVIRKKIFESNIINDANNKIININKSIKSNSCNLIKYNEIIKLKKNIEYLEKEIDKDLNSIIKIDKLAYDNIGIKLIKFNQELQFAKDKKNELEEKNKYIKNEKEIEIYKMRWEQLIKKLKAEEALQNHFVEILKNSNNKLSKTNVSINDINEKFIEKIFELQNYLIEEKKSKCVICGTEYNESIKFKNKIIESQNKFKENFSKEENFRINLVNEIKKIEKEEIDSQNIIKSINGELLNQKENINRLNNQNTLILAKLNEKSFDKDLEKIEYDIEAINNKINEILKYALTKTNFDILQERILKNKNEIEDKKLSIKLTYESIGYKDNIVEPVKKLENENNKYLNEVNECNRVITQSLEGLGKLNEEKANIELKLNELKNRAENIEIINENKIDLHSLLLALKEKNNNNKDKIKFMNTLMVNIDVYLSNKIIKEIKEQIQVTYEKINLYRSEIEEVEKECLYYKLQYSGINELNEKLPSILNDLMLINLKKYNELINKFFFQISPFMGSSYINIIPKDKNLYLILSENNNYDELIGTSENELIEHANASLNLSSAQVNVLALSIFLSLNRTGNLKKLNIVAIDDPIQNMDDMNIYSFIDILTTMSNENQMIISTHNNEFAELLLYKSQLEDSEIEFIKYIGYDKNKVYIEGDNEIDKLL
ncbi:AAA family ATPase [Clostridium gasigenes]|uniref:Nuclease SbcCD subunit C n=1 Tax=Clostridium gasigenes TaxID=94869 RepID=A0A1H0LTC5_9CLOT|nr:AAA family ATPase [Clostridium gasigenes]SDO71394.1 DNA repair exonuclease SbcCD ATPase subunit [Clostridium gasigenes]